MWFSHAILCTRYLVPSVSTMCTRFFFLSLNYAQYNATGLINCRKYTLWLFNEISQHCNPFNCNDKIKKCRKKISHLMNKYCIKIITPKRPFNVYTNTSQLHKYSQTFLMYWPNKDSVSIFVISNFIRFNCRTWIMKRRTTIDDTRGWQLLNSW